MSYTKTTWRDNQSPAINADNLNHIEQGIYDAHDGLASTNNNMELMDNRLQSELTTKVGKSDILVSGEVLNINL
jgi:hypothetical protein